MEETFSLFWDGPYSQWYTCPFTFYGIKFNCNEQMMMYAKAITFGDEESARAIMATENPRAQKKIGRGIAGYTDEKWKAVCNEVVYVANFCKFVQNPYELEILLADEADVIVEASPYDTVWGIGLGEADPRCLNREEWLGENRLGQMITDVRKYLRDPATCQYTHYQRIRDAINLFSMNSIL